MKESLSKNSLIVGYSLFWAFVFFLNTGPHWGIYSSTSELLLTVGMITVLQQTVALITLSYLLPKLLNPAHYTVFFLLLFLLLFIASELNILIRYLYFEREFSQSYTRFLSMYGHMDLLERMFSLWSFKYIFFTKLPLYFVPTAMLVAYNFHSRQKDLLQLRQQKSKAELDALKNQLNPHFIFNTLNNLYVLALKKSDKAPVVIEKLSNILDYILYRCNNDFVPLDKEIYLIESFIDLEKIRYGKRVRVEFKHNVVKEVTIAPLIILTLIENAFKHSAGNELKTAKISIDIMANDKEIVLTINNSKPSFEGETQGQNTKIGLSNLNKQLQLLYAKRYEMIVKNSKKHYQVELSIQR